MALALPQLQPDQKAHAGTPARRPAPPPQNVRGAPPGRPRHADGRPSPPPRPRSGAARPRPAPDPAAPERLGAWSGTGCPWVPERAACAPGRLSPPGAGTNGPPPANSPAAHWRSTSPPPGSCPPCPGSPQPTGPLPPRPCPAWQSPSHQTATPHGPPSPRRSFLPPAGG
jgi:hypothetical protein